MDRMAELTAIHGITSCQQEATLRNSYTIQFSNEFSPVNIRHICECIRHDVEDLIRSH